LPGNGTRFCNDIPIRPFPLVTAQSGDTIFGDKPAKFEIFSEPVTLSDGLAGKIDVTTGGARAYSGTTTSKLSGLQVWMGKVTNELMQMMQPT
jgi:hypothetical protein